MHDTIKTSMGEFKAISKCNNPPKKPKKNKNKKSKQKNKNKKTLDLFDIYKGNPRCCCTTV